MAASQSTINRPEVREIIFCAAAWAVTLGLSLSNRLVPADVAMGIAMAVPTLGWVVFINHPFRHQFVPAGAAEGESEDEPKSDDAGWGIHRRWLLSIVTPVIIVILLTIAYDVDELLGPGGARIPAPIALVLLFAALPWVLGLVGWVALVVPGQLIISGLRRDVSSRGGRMFGGLWAYMLVAFGVTAAQGAAAPIYGRPGWMGEGIGLLLGLDEQAVTSPGWMFAARVLAILVLVVMPISGIVLLQRAKKDRARGGADSGA